MEQTDLSRLLPEGAEKLGLLLTSDQILAFEKYLNEIRTWGKRMNLIRRLDDREIILKDFLDSLTILKYISQASSIIDIGSGAGFPGIPLKIVRPDLSVVLLEAIRKKVYFLKNTVRKLGLKGIEAVWAGETEGMSENFLGVFDYVISRALGSLLKFTAEGFNFLKPRGILIAMKGKKGTEELEKDLPYLSEMGLKLAFMERFVLPFLNHERILIGLKKE